MSLPCKRGAGKIWKNLDVTKNLANIVLNQLQKIRNLIMQVFISSSNPWMVYSLSLTL